MFVVKEEVLTETVVLKSRFIAYLIPVSDVSLVSYHLENLKKKYKDATHYCYAYIIGQSKKCSDDKEPSGTAGIPILNCLIREDLTNVLCVVIRYFGGIKLGAGGLIRAYKNSCVAVIKNATLLPFVLYDVISLQCSYELQSYLDHVTKNYEILEKSYSDVITYVLKIPKKDKESFLCSLNSNITILSD